MVMLLHQNTLIKLTITGTLVDYESQRLVNKDYGQRLDAERSRRYDTISTINL